MCQAVSWLPKPEEGAGSKFGEGKGAAQILTQASPNADLGFPQGDGGGGSWVLFEDVGDKAQQPRVGEGSEKSIL